MKFLEMVKCRGILHAMNYKYLEIALKHCEIPSEKYTRIYNTFEKNEEDINEFYTKYLRYF